LIRRGLFDVLDKRCRPHALTFSTPRVTHKDRSNHSMDPTELHAKATIAAALITAHAVGVPSLPNAAARASGKDEQAARLRELTDYVYQALFGARG
jgi:hypothetical protein